ncbi:ABC transporter ATP-binding protein [Streptomyces sp. NPDC008163]|uniref:ABC transporter ATP-binding protein n=1 Tax=Streptomyces sp. NPDC008163 TaxID=3364818 RepID=UPI0036EE3E83
MSERTPVLELIGVDVHYSGVQALHGLTLSVMPGEVVTLLGGNGAGKTSTLSAISGLETPSAGRIIFEGQDITRARPHDIVGRGLVHVPEGRRVFSRLTVHENLQLGGYLVRSAQELATRLDRVCATLPRLAELRGRAAGSLSGGEQQMVAIGRALMAEPRLLMLDEPSMGLAPGMVATVMGLIRDISEQGTAVLLVEQNTRAAMRVADRGYVLDTGTCVVEGPVAELADDPRIAEAYLGFAPTAAEGTK